MCPCTGFADFGHRNAFGPSSASQCVAGIACAEIPGIQKGPELIPQLVANVTNPNSTEHMKESTLEAIGYICQDIVSTVCSTYILLIPLVVTCMVLELFLIIIGSENKNKLLQCVFESRAALFVRLLYLDS